MMRSKLVLLGMGAALLLAVTGGCSRDEPAAEKNPAPANIAAPPVAAGNLALPLTGKVAEIFESGGYTYLRLETEKGEYWAATGIDGFREGDAVSIFEGQLMEDFYSPSLERTFPEIIFASNLSGAGEESSLRQAPDSEKAPSTFADALKNEQPSGTSPASMGATRDMSRAGGMGRAPAEVSLTDIKVEKATGENAYRVAELHQQGEELNGKEVVVRGQVMKVSPQIMSRNWIHLQDGSGDIANNTHNLVVTSDAMPEKGEVITIKGIFQADLDIGAGYKYAALVEQAEIIE